MPHPVLRLNKYQLDALSSLCGLIAGILLVLVANGYYPRQLGTSAGVIVFISGWLQNKPATASPTTEEAEQIESDKT